MKNSIENEKLLTQHKLKEILEYNPETGKFYWKEAIGRRIKKEQEARRTKRYMYIQINRKKYLAHRLAWLYIYGEWPKDQIDHINRNRADNRIYNLREVDNKLNQRNKVMTNNKSSVKGVCWSKNNKKWYAQIKNNNIINYLGIFNNFIDAVKARYEAERKLNWEESEESSAYKYLKLEGIL